MQPLGTARIELRQALAKRAAPQQPVKLDRFLPDVLGDFGNRRQPVLESMDIESGAADENGLEAGSGRSGDLVERERPPSYCRTALGRVEKTVEPVRHAPFGGLVRTGC